MVGTAQVAPLRPYARPDGSVKPESAPFALIPTPAVDTVPRDSKPPARA